jgi:hypothetical protein
VICPASLKSQWRMEIERVSCRTCHLVLGGRRTGQPIPQNPPFSPSATTTGGKGHQADRANLLGSHHPRRRAAHQKLGAKTSRIIHLSVPPFALVLSGTPLENRLEELYTPS